MYIDRQRVDIKDLIENKDHGFEWFCANIVGTLMESVDGKPPVIVPEDFSLRELHEAVDVSQFPVVTGLVISKKIMASYDLAARIGDSLVQRMPSDKQIDRIPRLNLLGNFRSVNAGMPYDHSADIEEQWTQIAGRKYGEILDITEEAIMFDQTNSILVTAGRMGDDAAMFREEMIVNGIMDLAGYYTWYPGGTREALYANAGATANHVYDNTITNVLADHTDIDAALQLFVAMRNSRNRPINIVPNTILVPKSLLMTTKVIIASGVIIGGTNATPNPVQNEYAIASSPYVDANSTTEWYIGDFKKQFVWKEVIPLQVLRRGRDTEEGWNRDIVASYKVRFYGTPGALDYMYVIRSSGTV